MNGKIMSLRWTIVRSTEGNDWESPPPHHSITDDLLVLYHWTPPLEWLQSRFPSRHSVRRILYWRDNPRCHWCGKWTHLEHLGNLPHDHDRATIDHLYSTIERRQMRDPAAARAAVLACWRCNNLRARTQDPTGPLYGKLFANGEIIN